MDTLYDGDTFEVDGLTFRFRTEHDIDAGRPWENADGHGPVRETQRNDWGKPGKRAGERILNRSPDRRDYLWAYDWAEAMRIARRDGWGLGDEALQALRKRLGREPTKGEMLQAAVQSDFDYLAGWVSDEWHYIGVIVTLLVEDEDGDLVEYDGDMDLQASLWCVEDKGNYPTEVAHELASDIAHQYRKELAERQACAERDIVTVGR